MNNSPLFRYLAIVFLAGSCTSEPAGAPASVEQQPRFAPVPSAPPPAKAFDPAAFAVTVAARNFDHAQATLRKEGVLDHEPTLHIGRRAPRLKVDGWLKGKPVIPSTGNIYVVENWATWCKPCIEAMPHLSTLAEKHAASRVVVVAINVEDSEVKEVREFVAKHASDLRYSVGYDRSGFIDKKWIKAAGLRGLPASFVIGRDGRVAWIGHPTQLARVVDDMVGGRWDNLRARRTAARRRLTAPAARRVVALLETEPDRAYALARVLMATLLRDKPDVLLGLAYHILAAPAVAKRDLKVAYTAAALANQIKRWSEPDALETLSKIREAQKMFGDAIALQRHAVTVGRGRGSYAMRLRQLTKR